LYAKCQKAASMKGKTVRLWNTQNGRDYAKFDIGPWRDDEKPFWLRVSENRRYFAVATTASRVILWDNEKRTILRTWPIQEPRPQLMRFSEDSQWLVLIESGNCVRLIGIGSTLSDSILDLNENEGLTCLTFSPDGRQLACAVKRDDKSKPGRIIVYEMASRKIRAEFCGHGYATVNCLAYSPDAALLASGSNDTSVLVWQTGLREPRPSKVKKDDDLRAALTRMAGDDARAAFAGMIRLAKESGQAVRLLSNEYPPADKPDLKGRTISAWIKDLGHDNFGVRNKAGAFLLTLGPVVEKELRDALTESKDLEAQQRIEKLLKRLAARPLTSQEIVHFRAVELAEAIATPEASALIRRWSEGDPGAVLTEQARLALGRMP
jgi:WD40 repeat protein